MMEEIEKNGSANEASESSVSAGGLGGDNQSGGKKKEKKSKKVVKTFGWIVRCFVCLVIGVVVGVILVKFGFLNVPGSSNEVVTSRTSLSATTVREKLEAVGDLSTYRAKYTDIQEYDKNQKLSLPNGTQVDLPLTDDKSLLVFSGTIDFRYNLKNMDVNVDNSAKTITVNMPELEAVSTSSSDNSVKEYKIADSVFTAVDLGEYEEARAAVQESKREELLVDPEVVASAQESAKNTLTSLLMASDDLKDQGYKIYFNFA